MCSMSPVCSSCARWGKQILPRLVDVALVVDDPVGIGDAVVAEKDAMEEPGAHVPQGVVLRALPGGFHMMASPDS